MHRISKVKVTCASAIIINILNNKFMEHKNYSEYKRLTLVEPPYLYYSLLYIITILAIIVAVLSVNYFHYEEIDPQKAVISFFIFFIVETSVIIRLSRERALIHDNGNLEVYGLYNHKITPISTIKQVIFKKRYTICGKVDVIQLKLAEGEMPNLLLKDIEHFVLELKKYNPTITIPELPVS